MERYAVIRSGIGSARKNVRSSVPSLRLPSICTDVIRREPRCLGKTPTEPFINKRSVPLSRSVGPLREQNGSTARVKTDTSVLLCITHVCRAMYRRIKKIVKSPSACELRPQRIPPSAPPVPGGSSRRRVCAIRLLMGPRAPAVVRRSPLVAWWPSVVVVRGSIIRCDIGALRERRTSCRTRG